MAMPGFPNLAQLMGEAVVTVLVGPDEKRYTIHKSLLTAQSEYFDRALNGKFKEADEQTIRLTEETPGAFDLLIGWLYQGHIPVAGSASPAFDVVPPEEDTEDEDDEASPLSKPQVNTGTFHVQYTTTNEPLVVAGQVATLTDVHTHICRQPFYQSASPEELRLEDYAQNRRFSTEVRLPPAEPFPVATGPIKGIPRCPPTETIVAAEEAHQLSLLSLCLFAEIICWTPLFNLAMSAYVEGESNLRRRPMPKEHVQLIYQRAHDESPCRKFAADSAIAQIGAVGQVDRDMDLVDQWPAFLEDIFKRMSLSSALMRSRSPRNMPLCEYHDHRTQSETVHCAAVRPPQRPLQRAMNGPAANPFRYVGDTMDWLPPAFPPGGLFSGFTSFTGAAAAGATAFGGLFGAPRPAGSLFGAAQPAAQPGTAPAAGAAPSLFGAPQPAAQASTATATAARPSVFGPPPAAAPASTASATGAAPSLFGAPQPAGQPATASATAARPSLFGSGQPAGQPSAASAAGAAPSLFGAPQPAAQASTASATAARPSLFGAPAPATRPPLFGPPPTSAEPSTTAEGESARSSSAVFGQVSPLSSKLPPPTVAATASGSVFGSSFRAASAESTSSSAFSGASPFATTAASSRSSSASGGIFGTGSGPAMAQKASSGSLFGGGSGTATTLSHGGIFGGASAVRPGSASSGLSGDSTSGAVPGVSNPGSATNATSAFSAATGAPREPSASNGGAPRSRSSSASARRDEKTDPRVRARSRQRIRYKYK